MARYENDAANSAAICWLMASRTEWSCVHCTLQPGRWALGPYHFRRIMAPCPSRSGPSSVAFAGARDGAGRASRRRRSDAAPVAGRALAPRVDAWEAGHYPAALGDLRALMQSPAAAEYLERVALLTGELFVTTELTTDGRNPAISADGRSRATRPATPNAVIRIVRIEAGAAKQVAELTGAGLAFDPAGTRVAVRPAEAVADWSATVKMLEAATRPQNARPAARSRRADDARRSRRPRSRDRHRACRADRRTAQVESGVHQ